MNAIVGHAASPCTLLPEAAWRHGAVRSLSRPALPLRHKATRVFAAKNDELLAKPVPRRPREEQAQQKADAPSAAVQGPTPPSPASSPAETEKATSRTPGVSLEHQRSQAKLMLKYFREKQAAKIQSSGSIFGWNKKNEILNGRWVMMGIAIGLLTEYATGVSLVDQIKLMISYLGLADIYD
ncbi:OHP2 [Auxenochlorella protothecoides x Auxenochlorella symbiontica]